MLVLLRHDSRRYVGQHEDGHLELVVADVPVGILCHLERLSTHEDRAGLFDHGVHICGAMECGEVTVETVYAAALISDESIERGCHPDDHSCHKSSVSRHWPLPVTGPCWPVKQPRPSPAPRHD